MKTSKIIVLASVLVAGASVLFSFRFTEKTITMSESQTRMVADWERAKAYTLEYINAANDEAIGFKPTADMRTFGQQMLHLSEANYGVASAASGKTSPVAFGALEKSDQYKTRAALAKAVGDSYDFVIAAVKEMNDQKLGEMVKVFNFDMDRATAFGKAFEHQTHHRGQTTVYLRLKGIKPPDEKLF